jgi:TPR repeat protein
MTHFAFRRTAVSSVLVLAISSWAVAADAKPTRAKRSMIAKNTPAIDASAPNLLKEKPTIFSRELRDALLTQRYDSAAKLLEPIAAGGKAEAMAALGSVLLNLPAATKDAKRAEKLLIDAAGRGYDPANRMLAQMYYAGEFNNAIPQYSKAWDYIYPLAQKDDPLGLYLGGRIIRDGLLGSPNDQIGREMIMQAAKRGNIDAQREIGRISRLNDAPAIDDRAPQPTAFGTMDAAARKGNIEAAIQLGVAYFLGFGAGVDYDRAKPYFEMARSRDDIAAGVILDYMANASTLTDAVKNRMGKAPARAGLGYAVLARRALEGRGIEKNVDDALFFALVAGYLGSPDAAEMIKTLKADPLTVGAVFDGAETKFNTWRDLALGASPK